MTSIVPSTHGSEMETNGFASIIQSHFFLTVSLVDFGHVKRKQVLASRVFLFVHLCLQITEDLTSKCET